MMARPFSIPVYIQNTIWYLIIGFLPMSVNIIVAPIYTNYFGTDQYGIIGLAGIFQSFATVLIALGITGAVSRYYFDYYKQKRLKNSLYSTAILLILVSSLAIFIVLEFSGEYIFSIAFEHGEFSYLKYGRWLWLNSISAILNVLIISYYRNEENLSGFALASISFFLLSLTGNLIGVIAFESGAFGSIVGRSLGGFIAIVPYLFLFLKRGNFIFRTKLVRSFFAYGLPLVPYGLLMVLYENVDKLMIDHLFGLDELGLFTFASQLSGVCAVLIFALFNALSPAINKLLAESNISALKIHDLSYSLLVASFLIIAMSIALINPFLNWFIPSTYHSISLYAPMLFVAFIGRAFYLYFIIFLLYYHKTGALSYITASSIISGIVFAIVTYQELGIISIYISVIIIKLIQAFMALLYIKRYKLISPSMAPSIPILFVAGALLTLVPFYTWYFRNGAAFSNNLANLSPLVIVFIFVVFYRKKVKSIWKSLE